MSLTTTKEKLLEIAKDIREGDLFTTENLRIVRPGDGGNPSLIYQILGKQAKRSFSKGEPLTIDKLL